MARYIYSLSKRNPILFNTCVLPTGQIPVRYDDLVQCTTSIDSTGNIHIELPDELPARIDAGLSEVLVYSQRIPPHLIGENGKSEQITVIKVVDKF
jgi:hypothetical protein